MELTVTPRTSYWQNLDSRTIRTLHAQEQEPTRLAETAIPAEVASANKLGDIGGHETWGKQASA
jgi:hypothetical protein